ncbi:MAG: orotate phosphoribosyltransferase [Bernardetiaceae bacterium]|jgi:orotate phosphoribosyltransferase|nr:orotate phosphoribosyltransferase [Bernardetiaceae bacterium]
MTTAYQIASMLLQTGAVKLSPTAPFTWASGWQSPIYCDNRLLLSYPLIRRYIKNELAAATRSRFPQAEAVAGVATAGIPQGALLADELGLPFLYVRPKPKDHGLENLIEGRLVPGQQVLVVEDLISTGGSSLKAAKALTEAGAKVVGMLATFTYDFALANQAFAEAQVPLLTLCNYPTLLQVAAELGVVDQVQLASLEAWRQNPAAWGK